MSVNYRQRLRGRCRCSNWSRPPALRRVPATVSARHPARVRARLDFLGLRANSVRRVSLDHLANPVRLAVPRVTKGFLEVGAAFRPLSRIRRRAAIALMGSVAPTGPALVYRVGHLRRMVPIVLHAQLDSSSITRVTVKFANLAVLSVPTAQVIA